MEVIYGEMSKSTIKAVLHSEQTSSAFFKY